MLGIGCPDRHPLPRFTSSKLRRRRVLPSRASGFVQRRVSPIGAWLIPRTSLHWSIAVAQAWSPEPPLMPKAALAR